MDDLQLLIHKQLSVAKDMRSQIESEKDQARAALVKQLEQVDASFDDRLKGASMVIDGFEKMLTGFGTQVHVHRTSINFGPVAEMRPTVKRVFLDSNGAPLHLDEIERRVVALGVQSKAQNLNEAVRQAIYGLIDKGEPIMRVAERTWAWGKTPMLNALESALIQNEAQAAT